MPADFPETDFQNVITDIPNLTLTVSRFEADSLDITIFNPETGESHSVLIDLDTGEILDTIFPGE